MTRSDSGVPRRVLALLALWALALTTLLGVIAGSTELKYIDTHSLFYDSASYIYQDSLLAQEAESQGRFSALVEEIRSNDRYPLRTIPLLIAAPDLLRHPLGQMVTALPTVATFLFLLGVYAARSSGGLPVALAATALFASIPGLLSPTLGLGAYLLDLPAALLTGSAVLCLLLSRGMIHTSWVIGSGVLASAAILSRYTAVVFTGATLFATILAIWLAATPREKTALMMKRALPLVIVSVVLAGPFLLGQYGSNFGFYSQYGYALRHPAGESALSFIAQTAGYLRVPGALILSTIFLVGILGSMLSKMQNWRRLLEVAIPSAAAPLVLIVALGASGHNSAMLYALPSVFLVAVVPLLTQERWRPWLSVLILSLSTLILAVFSWSGLLHALKQVSPANAQTVAVARSLAPALARIPAGRVCSFYLDADGPIYALEAARRNGRLCAYAGSAFFYDHARGWDVDYPGMGPGEAAKSAAEAADRWADVVIVPMSSDPTSLTWLSDPRSRAVAARIGAYVSSSPRWRRLSIVDGGVYGQIGIYENSATKGRGYPLALKQQLTPFSKGR